MDINLYTFVERLIKVWLSKHSWLLSRSRDFKGHFLSCSFSVLLECFLVGMCHSYNQKQSCFRGEKRISDPPRTYIPDSHHRTGALGSYAGGSYAGLLPDFFKGSFKRNSAQSSSLERWAVYTLQSSRFGPCMQAAHPRTTHLYLDDIALFSCLSTTHLHDWHFDIALNEANKENLLKNQLTENLLNKGT